MNKKINIIIFTIVSCFLGNIKLVVATDQTTDDPFLKGGYRRISVSQEPSVFSRESTPDRDKASLKPLVQVKPQAQEDPQRLFVPPRESEGRSRSSSVRRDATAKAQTTFLFSKPSGEGKNALIKKLEEEIIKIGYQGDFNDISGSLSKGYLYLIGKQEKRVRIPDSFWSALLSLTWLKSISVANYELTLPESIGDLKQLTSIRLKNNLLKSLPESICSLPKLRWINLENNRLESLPIKIQKLKRNDLQLDLKGNPLRERGKAGKTLGIMGLKKVFGSRVSIDPLQSIPQSIEENDFVPVAAPSSDTEENRTEQDIHVSLQELRCKMENELLQNMGELFSLRLIAQKSSLFCEKDDSIPIAVSSSDTEENRTRQDIHASLQEFRDKKRRLYMEWERRRSEEGRFWSRVREGMSPTLYERRKSQNSPLICEENEFIPVAALPSDTEENEFIPVAALPSDTEENDFVPVAALPSDTEENDFVPTAAPEND